MIMETINNSLASGTNYQFKVRTYKLVDDEDKYYGNWSIILVKPEASIIRLMIVGE